MSNILLLVDTIFVLSFNYIPTIFIQLLCDTVHVQFHYLLHESTWKRANGRGKTDIQRLV